MSRKVLNFLFLIGCYIQTINVVAQENLISATASGFENNGISWMADSSGLLSISNENPANGSYSIKYSNESEFVQKGMYGIETGHTIMLIRTATNKSGKYIVAADYDGTILGLSYTGLTLWKNELSGFMVHDMWCSDLDGDGYEEILVANADGNAYCIGNDGILKWQYKPNSTPMYAITVVHKNNTPYVVCGNFDLSIYYLSANGALVKNIHSSSYSQEKTWGIDSKYDYLHYANLLRPIKKTGGTEVLAVQGNNNHMQVTGSIYLFNVLENQPYHKVSLPNTRGLANLEACDTDGDGADEILLGNSQHYHGTEFIYLDVNDNSATLYPVETKNFGYLITYPLFFEENGIKKFFALHGDQLHIIPMDSTQANVEYLTTDFAFNGLYKDENLIFLASEQSGGSRIFIIDLSNENWRDDFQNISLKGKLKKVVENTDRVRSDIKHYSKPAYQREQRKIYLMTESTGSGVANMVAENIKNNFSTPIFLGGTHTNIAENWDRSAMSNKKYRERRDGRRKYEYTQQQVLDVFGPWYNGEEGISTWGGHGNDPYYFHLSTHKKLMDLANGKKTTLVFPELEDHSSDFAWVMEDLFYPMAEYAKSRNTNIYVRTKHNFWFGNAYLPMWKKMMDGNYPEVFVPSMEETTSKAVDISIPARVGVWASGAVNDFGHRSVPDNPSFDRSNQIGYQRIPNHFLRHTIFMMANGATYINNFAWNPDYMSVIWELLAKGALFVPKPDEVLSYSPVHLSMFDPDEQFMANGSNTKWQVMYNKQEVESNKFVFDRQNGTWIGAQVPEWDYSLYANGVKDRRQNFLPPMPNGMVLITPPQTGKHASKTQVRGALTDHLHPVYKNIMKEFYTNGRNYFTSDGETMYHADEYAEIIAQEIKEKAKFLPLVVQGRVAWVVAQIDPTHLRLTIVDGGYLNPGDRNAKITFQTVTPVKMNDILDGKNFDISDKTNVTVDVPCGLFRFIDIELTEPLN